MTNDPAVEPGQSLAPAASAGDARAWRTPAFATAAVFLLNATLIAGWVSRLPATRDRLDLSTAVIGVTLLMSGLGSLVAMPFVGRLAARWSSRPLIVVLATVCALCLVLLSVTPNAVTTGAVLFVFGMAYGSWDVAMNIHGSYVDRSAGRDYMPRYHAMWSVGAAVGAGIGALAAGLALGLTTHFAVAVLIGCGGAIAVVLLFFVDDREPAAPHVEVVEDDGSSSLVKPRLLSRRLVLLGVITLCACLLEGAAADWIALYLTDERAATASLAALGYGMWATAMALSRFSGTTLIERLGRARAIRLAGAVVLSGVVITLAAPGVYGALVGVLLWGAGVALVFPAAMSAGGETPGRAADGIAAVSTIGYGGFLVGPPLIGLVAHEIGLGRALWILPVLGLGIVLLAPVVKPLRPTT
ncbi:MAG: MFS transporter [Candidatus Nanopelagicales bacterium]